MPFDAPPDRLPPIGNPPGPTQTPTPQVYPIGEIVKNGMDQLNKILDTFSPLSQAERTAKMSKAILTTHLYQQALAGDKDALGTLFGTAMGDHALEDRLKMANIHYLESRATHPAGYAPKGNTAGADNARAIAASVRKMQSGGAATSLQQTPPAKDTMTESLGDTTLPKDQFPPVGSTTP